MMLNVCVECNGELKVIKKQFDFKIEDIPFRTKQKYERMQCLSCKEEYIPGIVAESMQKEFATARAFIAEQDRMYSYETSVKQEILLMHAETRDNKDYSVPTPSKQWQTGIIHYLRYMHDGDKVIIVPASVTYLVYCNSEDKLSVAARQFVKPDDYFKLTCIV